MFRNAFTYQVGNDQHALHFEALSYCIREYIKAEGKATYPQLFQTYGANIFDMFKADATEIRYGHLDEAQLLQMLSLSKNNGKGLQKNFSEKLVDDSLDSVLEYYDLSEDDNTVIANYRCNMEAGKIRLANFFKSRVANILLNGKRKAESRAIRKSKNSKKPTGAAGAAGKKVQDGVIELPTAVWISSKGKKWKAYTDALPFAIKDPKSKAKESVKNNVIKIKFGSKHDLNIEAYNLHIHKKTFYMILKTHVVAEAAVADRRRRLSPVLLELIEEIETLRV